MFAAMAVDAGRVRRSPILGLLGGLLGGGHHHHHEPIHHHHHDHHGIQITKYTFKHRCCLIPSFPYLMRTPWIAFNYFFNMLTVNIIIWFENNTRERRKRIAGPNLFPLEKCPHINMVSLIKKVFLFPSTTITDSTDSAAMEDSMSTTFTILH